MPERSTLGVNILAGPPGTVKRRVENLKSILKSQMLASSRPCPTQCVTHDPRHEFFDKEKNEKFPRKLESLRMMATGDRRRLVRRRWRQQQKS